MKRFLLIIILVILVLFLVKRKDMTWRQSIMKTIYPLIMLKGKLFPAKTDIQINTAKINPVVSFYALHATANNGNIIDLGAYKGKKVLIVNTASDCGFTGQYEELEKLHQQYKNLIILGFPANDFKEQEKKDDQAIAEFCKVNYGVTFQLMQKSHVVKGPLQNAIFEWVSTAKLNGWCDQQPIWNFTKYLVNEDGMLMGFYSQNISPMDEKIVSNLR